MKCSWCAYWPHRWCSSGPARPGSSASAPSPCRPTPELPSPTGTASASAASSTCDDSTPCQCSTIQLAQEITESNVQHKQTTESCFCYALDHLKQLVVGHFDVACHVPGEVHHGNHGLDALELIPLVTLHSQLVLMGWKTVARKHTLTWTQETRRCLYALKDVVVTEKKKEKKDTS